MSFSPNSSINQTIDMSYAEMKRSTSLKWISVNVVLFAVFAYDLSCKCPGHTSGLHYVELALAGALALNALLHARRLRPRASPRAPAPAPRPAPARAEPEALALGARWRPDASPPPAPPSPPAPAPARARDEFIADRAALAAYLRAAEAPPEEAPAAWGSLAPAPKHRAYQLSSLDTAEGNPMEQSAGAGSPQVWRLLRLEPERLTQWNLNLRLWIHVTILERLVREMDDADAAQAGPGDAPSVAPYLEPFPDKRYAARRVRELARGGCLSAYRWDAGGAGWDEAQPPDAELLLQLVATYLDATLPGAGCARPFSAEHVSRGPAPPPREPGLLRLGARPPHFALALGGAALAPERGRNNLLHALLLLLAAAARRDPPQLRRLHLGPAGLNMLWIIGR